MKYFFYLLLFVVLAKVNVANAQSNDLYNVKLKSGLLLKCELLKMVPDSFIVIRQYGQVNTIKYSEIESVEFIQSAAKTSPTVPTRTYQAKPVQPKKNIPDSGLSVGIQTGLCFGQNDDLYPMPTVSVLIRLSLLYSLGNRFQIGVALGLDPYLLNDAIITSMQGEGRFYFIANKPSSPFLHLQAGYGFNIIPATDKIQGGELYTFGFGQSFRDKKDNILSVILAYRSQNLTEEGYDWNNNPVTYHQVFNRLEAKVEFRF
jgi:hypothetical protein